jgi:putative ABC transport system permease protein
MSVWRMAWRYAWHEPAGLALRVALIALACALVSVIILVSVQFERILLRDAQGIDLVVGAKGSSLQLVLAGVYHLDTPPGNIKLSAVQALRQDRLVAQVTALAVGDSHRGYRIVGADTSLVTRLLPDAAQANALLQGGRLYAKPMEVVLGAAVARATGLQLGQSFVGAHGLAEGGPEHEEQPFQVVGILRPGMGVLDRLILTSLESVWATHEADASSDREVSLALVRYSSPIAAAMLPRKINAIEQLQAASPAVESARLRHNFSYLTTVLGALVLLISAIAVCTVAVNVAQAVRERTAQLLALRMAGAGAADLYRLVLLEVVLVALLGAMMGIALGHAVVQFGAQTIAPRAELGLTAWMWHPAEGWFALAVVMSCALASLWPIARVLGQAIREQKRSVPHA